MKVFKFGGASVKDAAAVRNLTEIVKNYVNEPLVVVVSAMGKTTNKLEAVCQSYFKQDCAYHQHMSELKEFHWNICNELFDEPEIHLQQFVSFLEQLETKLKSEPSLTYNFEYDQIVSFGELISTTIISAYLASVGVQNKWIDIRKGLRTNSRYRDAAVDFQLSEELIKKLFKTDKNNLFVSQGFIGATKNNLSTTLGREGSDYSGALLAYFLNAESLTVWKDVPGVLNADPKWFDDTELIENMDYTDAIELAFYGTSVIHPKTIQPLKRKEIPLFVRSFLHPEQKGTAISLKKSVKTIPSFIFKVDQVLLEICPYDLSFIDEQNLQHVFEVFSKHGMKINFMQNTAVNFKVCTNNLAFINDAVIDELKEKYHINKKIGLELITIRYYDTETIKRVLVNKQVILEHRSERTIQMVVDPLDKKS